MTDTGFVWRWRNFKIKYWLSIGCIANYPPPPTPCPWPQSYSLKQPFHCAHRFCRSRIQKEDSSMMLWPQLGDEILRRDLQSRSLPSEPSHYEHLHMAAPCGLGFLRVWPRYITSVVSNSLQPARLLCPCDSPGKNTGVGCHFLLQEMFSTQGSNLCLMSPPVAGGFFTTSATWEAVAFIVWQSRVWMQVSWENQAKTVTLFWSQPWESHPITAVSLKPLRVQEEERDSTS